MANPRFDYIKKYEPLWGSWYIGELIGEGSFGKVYKIYKEEWNLRFESALKLISIPTKEQYREAMTALDSNQETLSNYFEDAVKNIVNEVKLMYALRGNSNIISYEDHVVEKKAGEFGWDILIRMEFASSLGKHISNHPLTREDVIRLGMDICSAIDACAKQGILHRDIKDENIFVSSGGIFKLGDFGVSKELSRSGMAASAKGTPFYMAPEVFKGEKYDIRADLYSLGIVLYKLLNYGRLPFMPPYPREVKYKDSETSLDKRISGKLLPLPLQSCGSLGSVILKACSFHTSDRFISASDMKSALYRALQELKSSEKAEFVTQSGNTKPADALRYAVSDTVILTDPAAKNNTGILSETSGASGLSGTEASSGNTLNGGLMFKNDSFLYYSNINDRYGFYKMDLHENTISKLSDDSAWFINVSGDCIYYSNASDDDKLYKMGADGSGRQKISDDKAWDLHVAGEWIYYSNESDGYKLYKIKSDGSSRIKLNNDKSYSLCTEGNWIYYSNKDDHSRIYKIMIDGSRRKMVVEDEAGWLNVQEPWIYYCSPSDVGKIYRVGVDGTGKEKLSDDMSQYINLVGGQIYYSNKSDGGALYKMSVMGSEKLKLSPDEVEYIHVIDDWVYYCNKSDEKKFYKVKVDGNFLALMLGMI